MTVVRHHEPLMRPESDNNLKLDIAFDKHRRLTHVGRVPATAWRRLSPIAATAFQSVFAAAGSNGKTVASKHALHNELHSRP
jgi:hypothetical protein